MSTPNTGLASTPESKSRAWTIRLRGAPALARQGRLQISAGLVGGAIGYAADAYVPNPPWRPLTDREVEALAPSAANAEPGRTIEVIGVGRGRELRALKQRLLAEARVAQTAGDLEEPQALLTLGAGLLDGLFAHQCRRFEATDRVRLTCNSPGLMTSTLYDRERQCLLGVHLDSHEHRDCTDRENCMRLLSLNVSVEPRRFLFVPLALAVIAREIGCLRGASAMRCLNATDLARAYFALYPATAVISLTLFPGEAYVAPVQNMPHDGSTAQMRDLDMTLRLFGEFARAEDRQNCRTVA